MLIGFTGDCSVEFKDKNADTGSNMILQIKKLTTLVGFLIFENNLYLILHQYGYKCKILRMDCFKMAYASQNLQKEIFF